MQLARLRAYLRHNTKPALVIHNLDAYSLQVTHQVYDPGQYVPYLDEPELYAALNSIDPNVWKSRWLPLYGYAVGDSRFDWLLGIKALLWPRADDQALGFRPKATPWTEDFERFRRSHPAGMHVAIEPEGVRQMRALLQLCLDNGIPIVLVYSPEFEPVQSLVVNRDQIFARFEAFSREFGVPLLDYSASAISKSRSYFYNSQHLNAVGASAFSRQLAERLVAEGMIASAVPAQ
jgi:hypothetical protein